MKTLFKKIIAVLLAVLCMTLVGCKGGKNDSSPSPPISGEQVGGSGDSSGEELPPVDKTPYECERVTYELPELKPIDEAYGQVVYEVGGSPCVLSGEHRLSFTEKGLRIDDISVCGKDGEGSETSLLAFSQSPVEVRLATENKYNEVETAVGNYTEFFSAEGDIIAVAEVVGKYGSAVEIYDRFCAINGGFSVKRTTKVTGVEQRGGYATAFNIELFGGEADEYFVPSRIYGEYQRVEEIGEYLVSSSRLPTPVVMASSRQGKMLSVNYPSPDISTVYGDRLTGAAIGEKYLYGSLGFSKRGVKCVYPCVENGQAGNSKKFAALNENNDTQFSFNFRVGEQKNFNDRMSEALSFAASDIEQIDFKADLDAVYSTCIEDMSDLTVYRDEAYVLPFAMHVDDGSVIAYVAQCGYIGMQISCGYEMLRYGIANNDAEIYQNGFNVVNMWATTAVPEGSDSGIFCCYNNGKGYGSTAPTLRQLADGAEGMLDALRLMEAERPTENVDAWWNLVYGFAEFLVREQNADGSWYRAYDYGGNMLVEDNEWNIDVDDNTLADKKYSTQIPIRFLVRMYEYTGEESYLEAAKKAGKYVKTQVIDTRDYRGGTLDQKGVIEREAGIYAFYAMSALYSATGEKEWLIEAERAGAYALSFTFMHDFKVYNYASSPAGKALEGGCTAGMSPIIVTDTGASGVDVFSGYLYYECFKMYLWTGDEYYLRQALVLQNCQKRTMDLNGDLGYVKRSFMCEATGIINFTFATAEGGVWLPWITNSTIEPMTNMLCTFGDYHIENLLKDHSADELLQMLSSYGSGGYEYILN